MKATEFEEVVTEFRDRADFFYVYIREAHAAEEWSFGKMNGIWNVGQPESLDERKDVARKWWRETALKSPLLVDTMDDTAMAFFGAWPERLYVLKNGEVAYRGGNGPFKYNIAEMKTTLEKLIRDSQ